MRHIDLELRGDHIALDALLKATGLAASGGEAKAGIAAGRVQVDGQVELRRGRKVRAGQVVAVPGARVRVHVPASPVPADGVPAPQDAPSQREAAAAAGGRIPPGKDEPMLP